jgi:hypothetical protein
MNRVMPNLYERGSDSKVRLPCPYRGSKRFRARDITASGLVLYLMFGHPWPCEACADGTQPSG